MKKMQRVIYRRKRSLEQACHQARNFILGLFGRRILIAQFDAFCHVWLDDVEIMDAWRANVPAKLGVDGLGWLDIYSRDEQGQLSLGPDGQVLSKRKFGIARWMPKRD